MSIKDHFNRSYFVNCQKKKLDPIGMILGETAFGPLKTFSENISKIRRHFFVSERKWVKKSQRSYLLPNICVCHYWPKVELYI